MDDLELNSFLWYGYTAGDRAALPFATEILDGDSQAFGVLSHQEKIRVGGRILRHALTGDLGNQRLVVPISGGLDSRAILASMLTSRDGGDITTYTFGSPGTLDYEIGNLLARHCGTQHRVFRLDRYQYTVDRVTEISRRCDGTCALFQHAPIALFPDDWKRDALQVSGFMGDPLAGSHLPYRESATWDEARIRFARRGRYALTVDLATPGFDPLAALPAEPYLRSRQISYDEQLDFAVRQQCYVRPLVLLRGFDYALPFLHPEWVRFALSLPTHDRRGQSLYQKILLHEFPELFSLPAKTTLGLPLTAPGWRVAFRRGVLFLQNLARKARPGWPIPIDPRLNYHDFDRSLRERGDLRDFVDECLRSLRERDAVSWLDIPQMWSDHQRCVHNLADALLLLASLEIEIRGRE